MPTIRVDIQLYEYQSNAVADAYIITVAIKNGVSWLYMYAISFIYDFNFRPVYYVIRIMLIPDLIKHALYDRKSATNYLN